MTDLVVGIGEIGKQLYQLLKIRGFHVFGYDIDESKTITNKAQVTSCGIYDMIHICIPYHTEGQFERAMELNHSTPYHKMTEHLVIHSTVKVGTSRKYNAIYSPVRGVHHDMFECLKWFTKFYAWNEDLVEFTKRFPNCKRVDDTEEVVTGRFKIYDRETAPLVNYYKEKGILKEVDGMGLPEKIAENTLNEIRNIS